MNKVRAFLLDEDCSHIPSGEPMHLLNQFVLMRLDGHLDGRTVFVDATSAQKRSAGRAGYAAGLGHGCRVVRPYLFLGRSDQERLAFLCDVISDLGSPVSGSGAA